MGIAFYADVPVPAAVSEGLQRRGVDVLTSQGDGTREWGDEDLLQRATELDRVLVTQGEDFLVIANGWSASSRPFTGVVYAHQQRMAIGEFVQQLELLAMCAEPQEFQNRIHYLPLK